MLQKLAEEPNGREASTFLFSLGSHSKQAGDECRLTWVVSFVYPLRLPFPDHVHHFVALQGSPRRLHRKKAHPRLDQPFDEAVVLLHQVIGSVSISKGRE